MAEPPSVAFGAETEVVIGNINPVGRLEDELELDEVLVGL
jgi:hypothetical protein